VSVVADLDKPLPLADDSVDLVLASHALEHLSDLMATLKEIYRICKHGAQVCIVAPYYQQRLNFANPYHRQAFNEHTPRFWTCSSDTPLDPLEYEHPYAPGWALGDSDNSELDIDFRCVRMEFFYFPEYRLLPRETQRSARKKHLDVCDEIMYHLLVFKRPVDEVTMKETVESTSFYEPMRMALRRANEENEQLHRLLSDRKRELQEICSAHRDELSGVRDELSGVRRALALRESQVQRVLQKAHLLAQELAAYREGRVVRLWRRFFPDDLSGSVAPMFQQLKDDSLMAQDVRGFSLQTSDDLRGEEYIEYFLRLQRPNLSGILLALVLDLPSDAGTLGLELVSPTERIVTQAMIPLSQVSDDGPLVFRFDPVRDSDQGVYRLRVFVRDAPVPVRIFEWRRYSWAGLGSLHRRAFYSPVFA
jgi:SAM-dependent methyltransferase